MNMIETLTVYLGSSGHARDIYKNAAVALGRLIAQKNKKLVYGGMDAGLMGILARTALESGAHVTGIIPDKLKDSERILKGLHEEIHVEDLWDRKRLMFLRADAVIALPGGFGTLDESLEVLYWGHLKLHGKPLVLVNIEGYWDAFIAYIKTLPDFDPRFLIISPTVEEIFPALESWTPITPAPKEPDHFPHFEDEITRATSQPLLIDLATVENTYFAVCALGLKQLAKHTRAIGFLNRNGQFDKLLEAFQKAAQEHFITQKCLKLYDAADNEKELRALLGRQETVSIDLHTEKWGPT